MPQPTDFWGRPLPRGKAPDLGAFAFVPSLATEKARIGWYGWPYRFAPQGEMELPDPWAPPQDASGIKQASDEHLGGWYPVHHGYEVQILDAADPWHRTGAIYFLATAAPIPPKPQSDWRTMIITLDSERITVDADGTRLSSFVADAADTPPRKPGPSPSASGSVRRAAILDCRITIRAMWCGSSKSACGVLAVAPRRYHCECDDCSIDIPGSGNLRDLERS